MKSTMFEIFSPLGLGRALGALAFLIVISGLNCKMERPMAQGDSKFEQKFVDKVQGFRTEGRTVKVIFTLQAAEYTIEADSAKLKEMVSTLAEGWKQQSPLQLVVVGTKINAVEPAP